MAAKKRPRMGRPPGPQEKVRRNRLAVMLTDGELAKLEREAGRRGIPVSTLAYEFLGRAVRRLK